MSLSTVLALVSLCLLVLAGAFAWLAWTMFSQNRAMKAAADTDSTVKHFAGRGRLYAQAVQSANAAFLTTTLEGVITTWNPAAERLFGYSADDAMGKDISIIVDPEQAKERRENLARVLEGQQINNIETARKARDGRNLEVSVTTSPIRSAQGEIIGISEIMRDITARRRSDMMFRMAVEASPCAMIMADAGGLIRLVNAEAERLFGYEDGELIGLPVETLLPAALRDSHAHDRATYTTTPARRTMGMGRDLYGMRKDGGEVAVEIALNPIPTHDGTMVMASIVDITERKRHERELATRALELQRSNAELEQFAYVASHDLQEPLRMVASYDELLAERYKGQLDARADKYISYAVDGAKRMQRLVNDLLNYSRAGRRDDAVARIDLQSVLESVLKGLQHAVGGAGAKVEVSALPYVVANGGQIGQVFQNLIGNALKFRGARPPRITIAAEPVDHGWQFSVADNGIGIEAQYSERIFQMFQRLHDRQTYDGSGIGLTIAKKIVERHGGRIWFESVPGEGTTFFFTLPQAQEKAA